MDKWTRYQAVEVLAHGHTLIIEHPKYPGTKLYTSRLKQHLFVASFDSEITMPAGEFVWGEFDIVGFEMPYADLHEDYMAELTEDDIPFDDEEGVQ